jgi:hypothetical protein
MIQPCLDANWEFHSLVTVVHHQLHPEEFKSDAISLIGLIMELAESNTIDRHYSAIPQTGATHST